MPPSEHRLRQGRVDEAEAKIANMWSDFSAEHRRHGWCLVAFKRSRIAECIKERGKFSKGLVAQDNSGGQGTTGGLGLVLPEKKRALLSTGWTEKEGLAGEGPEVVIAAVKELAAVVPAGGQQPGNGVGPRDHRCNAVRFCGCVLFSVEPLWPAGET